MISSGRVVGGTRLREIYIEISRYFRTQAQRRPRTPHSTGIRISRSHTRTYASSAIRRSGTAIKSNGHIQNHDSPTEQEPNALQAVHEHVKFGSTISAETLRCLKEYERRSRPLKDTTSWDELLCMDTSRTSPDSKSQKGIQVNVLGYITSHRRARVVDFVQLVDPNLERSIQLVVNHTARDALASGVDTGVESGSGAVAHDADNLHRGIDFKAHTPVCVSGLLLNRPSKNSPTESTVQRADPSVGLISLIANLEIEASSITLLNTFPEALVAKSDTVFPPEQRHLQFRVDQDLRSRIKLRSKIATSVRHFMINDGFHEIETPVLFKSTPEGAREFVVPTRKAGLAYALPQSPQQYKQVLMASGFNRYFQFARCFRDEDQRADRQPEFTQLDLEMSFAGRDEVMNIVERVLAEAVWPNVPGLRPLVPSDNDQILPESRERDIPDKIPQPCFPRYTYEHVMRLYGSDKPDTRLKSKIHRVEPWLSDTFKSMLTPLKNPIVDMFKIEMLGTNPSEGAAFISRFLDSPESAGFVNNSDGMPGVAIYDPRKPMEGLASFGHEAAEKILELFKPEVGDILLFQARPNSAFTGGSTVLGNLRRELHNAAIGEGLLPPPLGFSPLWVVDFPLFSPAQDSEPGQGGTAGICSTHHPFTAPKNTDLGDLSKLITQPLDVIGDHYDLVINGVEVGGGSRRIHTAQMQELILKDILKLKPERIEDFRHLLNALDAGCPPHAGFALGFDRLMAMLTNRSSVRDVIAFPKTANGEDKFVGSPSELTEAQLSTYHLRVIASER